MVRAAVPAALAALLAAAPAAAQERWPKSLYRDALRMEAERKEYARAIDLHRKVLEKKDHPEGGALYAMLAQYHIGICNEKLGNVDAAVEAFKAVESETPDDPALREHEAFASSRERVARKGVDLWLGQFCDAAAAFRLRPWKEQSVPDALKQKGGEIGGRIRALDKDAVYGLRRGLDHPHAMCRDFAAATLAEVADEQALADLAGDLKQPSSDLRAGAAAALTLMLAQINEARRLDEIAAEIERRIERARRSFAEAPKGPPPPADLEPLIQAVISKQGEAETKARAEIEALRQRARDIRHHLPAAVPAADALVEGLNAVLDDPDPDARLAACVCAGTFGDPRTSAGVIKALDDRFGGVRAAACVACGLLRAREAVAPLRAIIEKDQPDEQEPEEGAHAKVAGRAVPPGAVRQAAAEALGRIGDVAAIPSLADALADNDEFVRRAAFEALRAIAGREIGEEKYRADFPLAKAEAAAKAWADWYAGTKAVDTLVERYRQLAFQWTDYNPVELFDEEMVARRAPRRALTAEEAKALGDAFRARTAVIEADIAAVGVAEAAPQLMKYIGGEGRDDPERRDPATRRFVAQVLGTLANEEVVGQLSQLAEDGSAPLERRTGAALALGHLKDPSAHPNVPGTLLNLMGSLDAPSAPLRAAAAEAIGRLKADSAGQVLITKTADTEPAVVVAVCRALAKLKPGDAVPALGDLLKATGGHEEALEFAAYALGEIASPDGVQALVHGRAHARTPVWETSQQSIEKTLQANAAGLDKLLEWTTGEQILKNQPLPPLRAFACRALGDLPAALRGDRGVEALISRIIDRNFPKEVHDYDYLVRKAAAESLVKSRDSRAVAALVRCLTDRDVTGAPDVKDTVPKMAEKGLAAMEDIRLVALIGLDAIAEGDGKPPMWEPPGSKPQTPQEMTQERQRWERHVAEWQAWQSRKEGRASAPPAPAGEKSN